MWGIRDRGTSEKDKPPILGVIQRGGQVVVRMLANVQQRTIEPVITAVVARGTLIHTDEYGIYARLPAWGNQHKTVCHARVGDTRYVRVREHTICPVFTGGIACCRRSECPDHLCDWASSEEGLICVEAGDAAVVTRSILSGLGLCCKVGSWLRKRRGRAQIRPRSQTGPR